MEGCAGGRARALNLQCACSDVDELRLPKGTALELKALLESLRAPVHTGDALQVSSSSYDMHASSSSYDMHTGDAPALLLLLLPRPRLKQRRNVSRRRRQSKRPLLLQRWRRRRRWPLR